MPIGIPLTANNYKASVSDRSDFEIYFERALNYYRQVRDTAEPLLTETDFTDRFGSVRWSRNSFTPLLDHGSVKRILVTMQDITELKTDQAALEHALATLASKVVAVCEGCNKVHDEEQSWVTMTQYLNEYSSQPISHTICNHCVEQFSE